MIKNPQTDRSEMMRDFQKKFGPGPARSAIYNFFSGPVRDFPGYSRFGPVLVFESLLMIFKYKKYTLRSCEEKQRTSIELFDKV